MTRGLRRKNLVKITYFHQLLTRRGQGWKVRGNAEKISWIVKQFHLPTIFRIFAKNLNITKCYIKAQLYKMYMFLQSQFWSQYKKYIIFSRRSAPFSVASHSLQQQYQISQYPHFKSNAERISAGKYQNTNIQPTYSQHAAHAPPHRAEHRAPHQNVIFSIYRLISLISHYIINTWCYITYDTP